MFTGNWQSTEWVKAAGVPNKILNEWVQGGHVRTKEEQGKLLYNEEDILRCRVQFNLNKYEDKTADTISYKFEE